MLREEYRRRGIGTLVVKQILMQEMMKTLRPIRERAAELKAKPEQVLDALEDGAAKARRIAQATMEEVREKFGLLRPKRQQTPLDLRAALR